MDSYYKKDFNNKDLENDTFVFIESFLQEELEETINIEEFNLDSITFIKLVVELEEKFNILFDDENLVISKYENISNLVSYVCKLIEI